MEIKEYLENKKKVHKLFIDFIDKEDICEENYHNLFNLIKKQNILESKNEIASLFHLITKISNNHNRNLGFFDKIEKVIIQFKKQMQQFFSNHELFHIFKRNKRVLLFLIEEKIIEIDQTIVDILINNKYDKFKYSAYFYNEIKDFINSELKEKVQKIIEKIDKKSYDDNRKIGENELDICKLIRNDSIDEFISYIDRNSMSLLTSIETSIFETNLFIIKNKPTLIQYAAFFGSIQIFKYLFLNKVELIPSLWIYAIHGRNPEIIHLLEEKNISPIHDSYFECFNESIKCHHNEIANYLITNYIDPKNSNDKDYEFYSSSVKSYNFAFIPTELNDTLSFYDLCQYDYSTLVKLLFMRTSIIINSKII